MLARLRPLLVKTPVLIAFGMVLVYFLFAYLLFPPLAKWGAERYIASKTGHVLTLAEVRFDPLRLSVTVRGLQLNEPDGKPLLGFDELFVDFEATSLLRWAYTLKDIHLSGPKARLELRADGSLNWSPFLAAFKDEEEDKDDTLPRLLIDHIALQQGEVDFVDRKVAGGFDTRLEPIAFELRDLSTLPDDKGAYTLSTRTQIGARVRWRGDLALNPILATGELAVDELPLAKAWAYAGARLNMAPPDGVAGLTVRYRAGYADHHFSLLLDRLNLALDGLALRGRAAAAPALKLDRLALSGGHLDLDQRQIRFAELALQGGQLQLQRFADGNLDIQEWFAAPGMAPAAGGAAPSPAPAAAKTGAGSGEVSPAWKIGLDRFALDGIAVRVLDAGYVQPVTLEVAKVRLAFKADAELSPGEPRVSITDLQAGLSGSRLYSAAMPDAPINVGDIVLEAGRVDLPARSFAARRFAVLDGVVQARRGADGRINVVELLRRQASRDTAQRLAVAAAQKAREWQYRIDSVEMKGGVVAFQDDGVRPAARLTLERIEAAVEGVSQDLKRPLPVRLGLRVKEGGQLEIAGKLTPATAALDAKAGLRGLQLAPAQPYLGQVANLSLASGQVSTAGRLRYGKSLSYSGGFAVDNLLLSESETGERFLAWQALASDDLRVGPDSLDIGTLRIEGLGAKLVIHTDKTTNLKQILKRAPGAQPAKGDTQAAAPSPGSAPTGPAKPARDFRVGIDSIQVQNGELDFADLSLALPFGTRIHQLKGYIHGIASQAGGTPAQLELDGLVDDYGLARASGQVNLLDPTAFMDIKTVFRNVEMTRLTPYSATFAGRRIASGKLSLDLEYKIKQRQLLGENQIIMDKLTLGERVESPTAKNLPLDLAIAILSDADGKIDLGLPVSGSLDDPEFSYGRIIWKAIVNVITKIVTAPFRALGKLLGGGAEKLEGMAFDPGSARVLPPERETLKSLAQALDKRPKLGLAVQGTWDAVADRAALKESRVRAAVAKGMAVKVPEGEIAPPVPMSNAKAQEAIEALYAERLGKDALKAFKARYFKANPDKQKAADKMLSQLVGLVKGQDKPLSAEAVAALQGKELAPLLYQGLLEHEPVGDDLLQALARQRAQAIADEMVVVNKVARERVQIGMPEAVEGDGKRVGIKLSLVVAPVAAPPAPARGAVTSPPDPLPQPVR